MRPVTLSPRLSRDGHPHLLIAGLGFAARAVAGAARAAGMRVSATRRARGEPMEGVERVDFADVAAHLGGVTHLLVSVPPDDGGDPLLALAGPAIAQAVARGCLDWIGYFSTTGVYGDRAGGWVDEATPPAPTSPRSQRRRAAEQAWAALSPGCAVDLFRLAGIYGPGRSPFTDLRAGTARRVLRPGHVFGRIHRDDIAQAVLAAIRTAPGGSLRIFNLADDVPAESAEVVAHAALLLGVPPPPAIPFAQAEAGMSAMARSFWAESRRVSSAATRAALGIAWRYPSYREGLVAILAEEAAGKGNGPGGAPG